MNTVTDQATSQPLVGRAVRLGTALAAAAVLLCCTACNQMQAKQQISNGLNALNAGQFQQAVADFQQAVTLDPSNLDARRHLATAYKDEVDASASPDANRAAITAAENVYQQILAQHPDDATDMSALAGLYAGQNDFVHARAMYQKAMALAPNDPTIYQAMGAMEWSETNAQDVALRTKLNIDTDAPLVAPDGDADVKRSCENLRTQVGTEVDDAIAHVQKALQLRPEYADAMASLNLLYREKADLNCGGSATAIKADLDTANDWNAKAIAERKAELARQNVQTGAVVLDNSQE